MDNIRSYYGSIEKELRRGKMITLVAVVASVCACAVVTVVNLYFYSQSRDTVFVVDKGSTVMATIAKGGSQRDLEVRDHAERFHELFFNLAPSRESQERNLERALHMADRSVYNYWNDQNEKGYYQRLVSANIIQEIQIDSVKLAVDTYPFPVRTYGKVFLIRESNITAFDFESECIMTETSRTSSNPHGLMIEGFKVKKYQSLGSRRRK